MVGGEGVVDGICGSSYILMQQSDHGYSLVEEDIRRSVRKVSDICNLSQRCKFNKRSHNFSFA